jgi:DNA-binding NtrC family response regulator
LKTIRLSSPASPKRYKFVYQGSEPTANSAKEALAMMADSDFDVILCDVVMPQMTGYGNDERAAEARRMGAADFLSKPFTMDDLVPLVRRTLERAPLLRRLHEANRRSVLGADPHRK